MSLNHGIGIELIQVRTGPSIGKPTYRGIQHLGGTQETIEEELRSVFRRMRRGDPRRTADTTTSATIAATASGVTLAYSFTDSCDSKLLGEVKDDENGGAIRARMEVMQKIYFESWKGGRARKAMLAFAQWF